MSVPALSGAITAPELILIRDGQLAPKALTDEERERLVRHVREDRHLDRPIWYVTVSRDWLSQGWSAGVYFVPDEATARYRKGRVLNVADFFIQRWAQFAADDDARKEVGLKDAPDTYIQVSRPDHPFGVRDTLPDRMTMPFDMPKGLSVDDVVGLVDLACNPPRLPDSNADHRALFMDNDFLQEAKTQPILRIERKADGTVGVYTGVQEGPLSGRGCSVQMKKVGDKWVVTGAGMWVS